MDVHLKGIKEKDELEQTGKDECLRKCAHSWDNSGQSWHNSGQMCEKSGQSWDNRGQKNGQMWACSFQHRGTSRHVRQ
jgi:hypothetical protein